MRQIFISHSSKDATLVGRLRTSILGLRPEDRVSQSSDHRAGPKGGTSWESWIRRSVSSSDVVVFVAGGHDSAWCDAELGMARLLSKPILPLYANSPDDISAVVGDIQGESLDQPIATIVGLIDNLVERSSEPEVAIGPDFVPYPGLIPLREGQGALLSGRSAELNRISSDFDGIAPGRGRFVVLSGPSGSGKSSLVRAGLLPRLRASDWDIAGPIQPQQLARDGLPEMHPDQRLVMILDQAEELLLLDEESRTSITQQLLERVQGGMTVLVVVRIEFRSEIGDWILKPIDHYIPYLSASVLDEVVRRPAKLAQLGISESLIDRLVRETGSGAALPLLAYTLHELWKERDRVKFELKEATLDELGGVRGVMNGRAQEALQAAGAGSRETTPLVLATLSRLASPTQNPPTRSPIPAGYFSAEERAWLDEFRKVGLVSYRRTYAVDDELEAGMRPGGTDLVDVTHEALFEWGPLAAAIRTERQRNIERRSIEQAARDWDAGGRVDSTLLIAGDRLGRAIEDELGATDPTLSSFIQHSKRQDRDTRIKRRWRQALAVVSVLLAVVAAYALVERSRANDARQRAEQAEVVAQSVRVAAQAGQAIASQRDLALLAAVAGYGIDPSIDTEGALIDALATPTGPLRFFDRGDVDWTSLRMVSPTGGVVITSDRQPATVDLVSRDLVRLPIQGLEVAEIEPNPSRGWAAVRARRPPSGWAVGVLDLATGAYQGVNPTAEVSAMVPYATGLAYGDVQGDVFAFEYDQGVVTEPTFVDRHSAKITDLAVSADQQWLASASTSGVRVHRTTGPGWTGTTELVATNAVRGAENVVFRQDGAMQLFAAGADPTIRRWRVIDESFVETAPLGQHAGTVKAMASSPDAPVLYTAGLGGRIQLWDAESGVSLGDSLRGHNTDVVALTTVGAGTLVSTDSDRAILWDLRSDRAVTRPGVVPTAWEEERFRTLVVGDGPLAAVTIDDRILAANGIEYAAPADVRKAWWTNESRLVVETGDPQQIDLAPLALWTVDETGFSEIASGLQAADVGRCLAAMADGSGVRFADVGECGTVPSPIGLGGGGVKELALSADDERLLVVYGNSRIEERIVQSGAEGRKVEPWQGIVATSARWLDDDTVVLGHDRGGGAAVVALDTSDPPLQLAGHDDAVWWIEFDEVRRRIFTAGQDGLIAQTDLASGRQVGNQLVGVRRQRENDPRSAIRGLDLLDGDSVLLVLQGFRLFAWELDPEALAVRACSEADRLLTAAETSALGLAPTSLPCLQVDQSSME